MLGRTHVVIAWASWAAVMWRPTPFGLVAPAIGARSVPDLVATAGIVAVGALLPDLDHPRALVARTKVMGLRPFSLPAHLLHAEFGHRGALHSLLAAFAVFFGAEYLAQQLGLPGAGAALTWGYLAHLGADLLTHQGVPLLWPLTRAKVALPRPLNVRTGGLGESLYLALTVAIATAYALGVAVSSGSP